ncbi:MAG: ribonuclease HII [Anaerolineales bacterium]|nr:ribonuclease HII [Anaerolineales bacterium]
MPDLHLERALLKQGHRLIAGVDEAGRGAWAGPVIAAAVILPLDKPNVLKELAAAGVNDSKQLTAKRRERLYHLIREKALAYGMGGVSARFIDKDGILKATRKAMQRAVSILPTQPEALLIDAVDLSSLVPLPQKFMPYGDSLSLSIAAASILAKVSRDIFMAQLDDLYPGYQFARHKGYGTRLHRELLEQAGPCIMHRHSFKPVANLVGKTSHEI